MSSEIVYQWEQYSPSDAYTDPGEHGPIPTNKLKTTLIDFVQERLKEHQIRGHPIIKERAQDFPPAPIPMAVISDPMITALSELRDRIFDVKVAVGHGEWKWRLYFYSPLQCVYNNDSKRPVYLHEQYWSLSKFSGLLRSGNTSALAATPFTDLSSKPINPAELSYHHVWGLRGRKILINYAVGEPTSVEFV